MDTWLHFSNLIRMYIGAKRTSGVNFTGRSVGKPYTSLTVVSPEPDFITTSLLASKLHSSLLSNLINKCII